MSQFKVGDRVRCTNLDGVLENDPSALINGIGDVYTVIGFEDPREESFYPIIVSDINGDTWYFTESELEKIEE